jgi:ubiquinone/menaquinone biosynthesis C-methylase UbiE
MEVIPEKFGAVQNAFSKQSAYFDEYDQSNSILVYMRQQVRTHVLSFLKPGTRMLELNAGTGLDAHFFANQGCFVHATDLSDGMIKKLKNRVEHYALQDQIAVQQCSYTELNQVETTGFGYVFSNFGGLNCIPDLREVTQHFPRLLKPGAYITFVVMPGICPWEIVLALKGRFKQAFRRFKKNGTWAHLEGEYFLTYYFSPRQVRQAFGKKYQLVKLEGLGSFVPPPDRETFPVKHPRWFEWLKRLDAVARRYYPFNHWADHFIITLQYTG